MQRLKTIFAKKAAPKVPEWPSYGNFGKVPQDTHFLKQCKGGTKETFSKIAQKVALDWKAQKHSGANNIIFYLVCPWSAKTGEDFVAKSGSKSARMAKLWQFSQGHLKPAFSKEGQRGDKKKFFKNRPKSGPNLKGPTALWKKRHYPLISMQVKRKDWKRFGWRKQLQKSPNNKVMAIFATSPKTRIFWKSAKGGRREIFQQSTKK